MPTLHLDTDIGGDIDDLCALAMLLNWPGVELVGVTTNSDDGGKRAGYARYALDLAGRRNVPVAAGADVSLGCYRVFPDLPDESRYWPEPILPAATPLDRALDLLERNIDEEAIIVGIGAYTNLALLEQRSPGILRRATLYLMGGYVFPPREGFPQRGRETDWNVQLDVHSADLVFQTANPTLIPLSITVETALRRAYLPRLKQSGAVAQLIARQAEAFAIDERIAERFGQTCTALPNDITNFLHDPLACAIALGWNDGVEITEIPLITEIDDGWLCQRVDDSGRPTQVVTQVDGRAFSDFWLDTVIRA